MFNSLRPHGLYIPWNSPGKNTGVGGLSLLQGVFPTHRLKPGLLHCRRILYQLSHKGSPKPLEWGSYPFSSGSSQSRNQIGVSCIAGSLSLFTFHALEKEMATHSSVLAWRIPGTGEPGELPSVGSHRVGHDWSDLAAAAAAFSSSVEEVFENFIVKLTILQEVREN